ncbi:MAG: hypothetical protein AAF772_14810 [Acidobacteriota bacterium]
MKTAIPIRSDRLLRRALMLCAVALTAVTAPAAWAADDASHAHRALAGHHDRAAHEPFSIRPTLAKYDHAAHDRAAHEPFSIRPAFAVNGTDAAVAATPASVTIHINKKSRCYRTRSGHIKCPSRYDKKRGYRDHHYKKKHYKKKKYYDKRHYKKKKYYKKKHYQKKKYHDYDRYDRYEKKKYYKKKRYDYDRYDRRDRYDRYDDYGDYDGYRRIDDHHDYDRYKRHDDYDRYDDYDWRDDDHHRDGRYFRLPRKISKHDHHHYRPFRYGSLYHRGHRHHHTIYVFPTWYDGRWTRMPYAYCEGEYYRVGHFDRGRPRFDIDFDIRLRF